MSMAPWTAPASARALSLRIFHRQGGAVREDHAGLQHAQKPGVPLGLAKSSGGVDGHIGVEALALPTAVMAGKAAQTSSEMPAKISFLRPAAIAWATLPRRASELGSSIARRSGSGPTRGRNYRYAVAMLRAAEQAETAIRHRLSEPTGAVCCTAGVATTQFAMPGLPAGFLVRYPKVSVIAHSTVRYVDIVGENYDVAVRAHSDPLPDSTLFRMVCREAPQRPQDLRRCPSLFILRTGVLPAWRLRHSSKTKNEIVMPLKPRLLSDDMIALKHAAIAGLGMIALPGYVCREEVRSGGLRHVLLNWLAGDSTFTGLVGRVAGSGGSGRNRRGASESDITENSCR
jgi:DNA-binding transcriptional LysR family regulator